MAQIYIQNVGCRLNYAEADALRGYFLKKEYKLALSAEEADIIIINTCAVTKEAERTSKRWLNYFLKSSKEVWMTGCLTEVGLFNLKKNLNIKVIPLKEKQKIVANCSVVPARSRAFLKIQDGCLNRCHYCFPGLIRGDLKSQNEDWIISECKRLVNLGYLEIVLCGLNLGYYGLDTNSSLAKLILSLKKAIKDDFRIRLSSIEPDTIQEEFLQALSESPICPHFHLPLQSASSKILRMMGRKYTIAQYRAVFARLFKLFPDANFGTDVIVGFPQEEEEDFNLTYNFLKTHPFGYFHIFPYSPRPGTAAFFYKGSVSEKIKKERVRELLKLREKKVIDYQKLFLGKIRKGVLEQLVNGHWRLMTDNYLRVSVSPPKNSQILRNRFYAIKIINCEKGEIFGEIVD